MLLWLPMHNAAGCGWRSGAVDGAAGAALAWGGCLPSHGRVCLGVRCDSHPFCPAPQPCSESMLGQAKQYLNEDPTLDPARYLLLRADVGRLPFATGSGTDTNARAFAPWGCILGGGGGVV